jgi:4-hydroxy-4-methyl-2-oxoglutarate aldolase
MKIPLKAGDVAESDFARPALNYDGGALEGLGEDGSEGTAQLMIIVGCFGARGEVAERPHYTNSRSAYLKCESSPDVKFTERRQDRSQDGHSRVIVSSRPKSPEIMPPRYFRTTRTESILRQSARLSQAFVVLSGERENCLRMKNHEPMSAELLDLLRTVDTCTISNAIETLNIRMRNDGYIQPSLSCLMPSLSPIVGYAVTGRIRTGAPPISNLCYYQRSEWWEYLAHFPSPKIMVLADVDHAPGIGAFVGEIHAEICRALGCVGYVTNGTIRDVPALERNRFQCFSGGVCVSHAYGHIVDFGEPVEIGCLKIAPGDILQGDQHGVQTVPPGIDTHLVAAVRAIRSREAELIQLCRSADFSLEKLTTMIRKDVSCPPRNHI